MAEPALMAMSGKQTRKKIHSIQDLERVLAGLRSEGRRVVHCHGVFDPLHIGHIRHFEQARKLGHVLVVTITPDRFVNKGPHRPVFPEELRAEAVASLECVDFVAVNQWPMAIEAIERLQPDVFAKGSEFRNKADRTGAIPLEQEAVERVGGRIEFTEDITFSASNLVNRHFQVFPKEVTDYLTGFSGRYSAQTIFDYLEGIRPLKILLVGEAIIDEYHYCEAIGKSSKEPTLAVKSLTMETFAGGVLAPANHLANFCDRLELLGMLGDRDTKEDFIDQRLDARVRRRFHHRADSPTIVKRRFIESYFFAKLFEVYEMNDAHMMESDHDAVYAMIKEHIADFDMVIVFDFGHEMIGPKTVKLLCDEARFLAVNTQSNAGNHGYHTVSKYPRADYFCVAEMEMRLDARDRRGDLHSMLGQTAHRLGCQAAVVTCGRKGCLCFGRDEGFVQVPALAGKVVDRVGAGDAFLSLTAPCVYQRAPLEIVGFIGNAAAAQAVTIVGNRESIEKKPLVRYIEHLLK
ncbi:MAG TPA: PfkB family carbohydrate kinase [Gemmataceae bacterium]|nr:PfkB family carbohydrate kinase [Gemmataceae bacterium]